MSRRLRQDAIDWLATRRDLLDAWDGSKGAHDRTADEMKKAGVLRAATANHFLRIDLYVELARLR